MRVILLILAALVACSNAQASDNSCLQGVRVAHETYRLVTLDPANPPLPAYRAAFEYRMKRQPFPANREHAANALIYIITRLKNADMVPFEEWQVDWAAQEYITKECNK
jgi:hypothetical protein